jgi:hypothetical protein
MRIRSLLTRPFSGRRMTLPEGRRLAATSQARRAPSAATPKADTFCVSVRSTVRVSP